MTRPAVLVMARAPRPGKTKTRLEPLVGPEGCARLQAALITRTVEWAREEARADVFVAFTPADAGEEVAACAAGAEAGVRGRVAGTWALGASSSPSDGARELDGADGASEAMLFPQEEGDLGARLAAATERVLSDHGGPLLTVGTDLPTLRELHARTALDDLDAGCDVSLGPAADGGYYLVAQREPHPQLFALPSEAWGGPDVFELTIASAHAAGLALGMLRLEVDLDTPADARWLLRDPALPPEIARLLRPA